MKYINLSFLLVVFCFTACQENLDLTNTDLDFPISALVATTDLTLAGAVGEYESAITGGAGYGSFRLHNVDVKLMFNDAILDETNTDESGSFSFSTQPVPNEGAFLLFESPGFHNNVIKVDTLSNSIYGTNLLRENFPNLNGEAMSNGGPYIKLKGTLQEPSKANLPLYYITNASGELIGTATPIDDLTDFTITTLADEELFLNYKLPCFSVGVVPLGSYSEDTDLGVLLDQSYDFSKVLTGGFFSNVYDCSGNNISDYSILFKRDGLTTFSSGTAGFGAWECELQVHPVVITLTTQNPRKYQEKIIDFSAVQNPFFDMTICEDDDTFIRYTVDNATAVTPNIFTFANVLPDGELLLKQKSPDLTNGVDIALIVSGATVGSNTSDVVMYSFLDVFLGANGITTMITMNDGEFVEGTFIGEAFDAYEVSQGILEGSFRARIQ